MTTKEVRARILETMGGKCERCGHADQEVLHLHHRDKTSKHPDYKNLLRWAWEENEL